MPVEALTLKGAEDEAPGGPGAVLVLEGVGETEHGALGQHGRNDLEMQFAQSGEDRGRDGAGSALDLLDRSRHRESLVAQPCDLPNLLEIAVAVAAVTTGEPRGRGEAVPALPHAQRARWDSGPGGELRRGQFSVGGVDHRERNTLLRFFKQEIRYWA